MTLRSVPGMDGRAQALALHHVGGKAGLVIGDRRVLLVDAGAGAEEGMAVLQTTRALGRPADMVAYSHGHWDHVRGGVAMPGLEALAHPDAFPAIELQLELERRSATSLDGGRPTTAIGHQQLLDLGGVRVRFIHTPGHAPGSVCVLVEEEGVLYAGDTVVTAIPPVFTDGDSVTLERTLRALADMPIETLVPGHGSVTQGAGAVRATILARADYVSATRARAADMFGPAGVDEIAAELALRARDGELFDPGEVSMDDLRTRHDRMVRALVAELGLRPRF